MEMSSKYIVVPVDEYKELLKIKLEGEIKAQYEEQIEDLKLELQSMKEQLDNEKTSSILWWNRYNDLKTKEVNAV